MIKYMYATGEEDLSSDSNEIDSDSSDNFEYEHIETDMITL